MNEKSIIRSIPLPSMPNVERKMQKISDESITNMMSLNNFIHGGNFEGGKANPVALNRLSIAAHKKLSLNKARPSMIKPLIASQIKEVNQKHSSMHVTSDKSKRKTKNYILHTEEDAPILISSSRNKRTTTELTGSANHRLTSLSKPTEFKDLIEDKCKTLNLHCKTFYSTIIASPKQSMKINLKSQTEENKEFLHRLLSEKTKERKNKREHSKVIRETNIISKINSGLGFDSLNNLKKILIKTPRAVDYSHSVAITEYTIKRQRMVNKAKLIMRKSEYKTRQCLKTMYEFESKV